MMATLLVSASLGLLKIILLSGMLYGYYQLFLRNKPFHQFNRWFLLSIPVLSLVIPMIPLPVSQYIQWLPAKAAAASSSLHPPSGSWNETDAITAAGHRSWLSLPSWQSCLVAVYIIVTAALLFNFIRQLRYIRRLTKKYQAQHFAGIRLFNTREPDAPFSFLKNIFWSHQLDLHTPLGRQILQHELNHVRQKHSLDLLFLRPLLACCWINPFFFLVHRELKIVHEFLADDEAVNAGDPYAYAESLVWQTVRTPSVSLLHPFFYSPIKRRINMITQLKTRTTLLGRVMSLPLLMLLIYGFGTRHTRPNASIVSSAKPITVVIDAGHGGIDPGAVANGVMEKDINLSIAKKIRDLSSEYNVKVLMTRAKDELPGGGSSIPEALRYRADMANADKADLFLAIHTEMQAKGVTGFSFFVTRENAHYDQSVHLGSILTESLNKSYPTDAVLKQRKEHIYVLDKTNMPALLLLCGNINNESDLTFIKKEENQEKVARGILEGIRKYGDQ